MTRQDKLKRYREALEDIAEPLVKLREDAKQQGGTLNGHYAVQLIENANWLREKARKALAP